MTHPLPLEGLKVLDFTTLLPGPLASLMLAEAGAEVTKIERLGGEEMRSYQPYWAGVSALFAMLNAGKQVLSLDLKDLGGCEEVLRRVGKTDILIEQFRPGVMARLGLDYEAIRRHNPRLIYCSISGYGQSGPLSGRAGHDLNYLAESGILALNPGPFDAPQVPPLLAADIAGGTYPAMINILLALAQRARSGEGQHLDISMTDGLLPFAFWALPQGWLGGNWPSRNSHAFTGGSPRYHLYRTADRALLAVAALEDIFWQRFCEAIDLSPALRDADAAEQISAIAGIIAARPASHWESTFADTDCCCSLVKTLSQAVESEQLKGRGLFDYRIVGKDGSSLTALPLPIMPALRRPKTEPRHGPSKL